MPESGSCSESAVTGTSINLTGLNGNTNHVYKAYSSSGCASDAELATAPTFLTKPGKPTKPTAEAGSGSGKLTVTASVTGSGTLSKWQYKQKEGTGNFDTDWTDVSSTTTSLSHVLTGLTDGTDYQYKVRARNASGFGAESDPSAAARPLDETLTASSVEATTATLTLGNYTGNWYYQYTSPSDGTCSSNAVTTSAADLANLSSNTSYTYKAYSDSDCSSNKELAAASAFLTKPGKPTKPTATAGTGSGQLTLAASVTGSGTLAKWQYKQKEGTDDFDDDWTDIDSTQTSLSHTLSGLTDSTDYQYKVRARNATGEGAESDASTAARPLDETLSASSVETTTATLTLGNYTGDWYYKYTAPAGGTCAASAVTASTKDLTELAGNTTYTFKAYSDSGCATELASETFLTKPGKPTRPTATPGTGSGKLTLKASITGDGTPAKWQYKEKEGNDWDADWTDVSNSASTSLSHTLSGLTDGTKYRYKVRAANATGDGVESDESAEATPADEALTASSVEAAAATLTLGNYAGNWWLKRTTPADTACKSKGTTYTEDLSSLSSNTSHTYKAYSDSSCTTELASETFLTKPGKPAKPGASPGAGSGKLTLTASVSGLRNVGKVAVQAERRNRQFRRRLDRRLVYLGLAEPRGQRPDRRHRLPVQGARKERQRLRGRIRPLHRSTTVRRNADGFRHYRHRRHPDARQLERFVVAQKNGPGRHHLQVQRNDVYRRPVEPVVEQQLHLQGLQQLRLHHGTGGQNVPDQARQADEADGDGRRRQRQADPDSLCKRFGNADKVAVQAKERHRRLRRRLDRYSIHFNLIEPHDHRPH